MDTHKSRGDIRFVPSVGCVVLVPGEERWEERGEERGVRRLRWCELGWGLGICTG